MTRRAHDYYPTTPDAVEALRLWLASSGTLTAAAPCLEPAAGRGALIRFMGPRFKRWIAIELQAALAEDLGPVCSQLLVTDSLALPWPAARFLAANPPFSHVLRFCWKAMEWSTQNKAVAAMLTRSAVWQTAAFLPLVERRAPDWELKLTWRPSFAGSGSPMHEHMWAVWEREPTGMTRTRYLRRPKVSRKAWELFARMQPGEDLDDLGPVQTTIEYHDPFREE